jgi:hypothetical protein
MSGRTRTKVAPSRASRSHTPRATSNANASHKKGAAAATARARLGLSPIKGGGTVGAKRARASEKAEEEESAKEQTAEQQREGNSTDAPPADANDSDNEALAAVSDLRLHTPTKKARGDAHTRKNKDKPTSAKNLFGTSTHTIHPLQHTPSDKAASKRVRTQILLTCWLSVCCSP